MKYASIQKQTEDNLTTFVLTTDIGQKLEQETIYKTFAEADAALQTYFA